MPTSLPGPLLCVLWFAMPSPPSSAPGGHQTPKMLGLSSLLRTFFFAIGELNQREGPRLDNCHCIFPCRFVGPCKFACGLLCRRVWVTGSKRWFLFINGAPDRYLRSGCVRPQYPSSPWLAVVFLGWIGCSEQLQWSGWPLSPFPALFRIQRSKVGWLVVCYVGSLK